MHLGAWRRVRGRDRTASARAIAGRGMKAGPKFHKSPALPERPFTFDLAADRGSKGTRWAS